MRSMWTVEKIMEGFKKFELEFGRLPTAPEIDKLSYLPSSRQIQRKFGGLEKLREVLGYKDTNFGRGDYRTKIALRVNKKGRESEIELEKLLRNKFGEVFVHTERIFDDSKNRVDFYVYSPDGNFGIDVFYTGTIQDLQKNINLKIDKYLKFPSQLYLVVANPDFIQERLNIYSKNKRKVLPANTTILTMKTLLDLIKNKRSYNNPLKI
jgi:hypothetical protein